MNPISHKRQLASHKIEIEVQIKRTFGIPCCSLAFKSPITKDHLSIVEFKKESETTEEFKMRIKDFLVSEETSTSAAILASRVEREILENAKRNNFDESEQREFGVLSSELDGTTFNIDVES